MPDTKQKTCQQCVRKEWAKVKKDLDVFMKDTEGNEDIGSFYDYGLCFDYVSGANHEPGFWRYQFSWGGPSDELRFFGDPDCSIYKVSYHFMDWFDGASIVVTDEPCVQWLIEWFGDTGSFQAELEKAREAS